MTKELQVSAKITRVRADGPSQYPTVITMQVACGGRAIDIDFRLGDLIKNELERCIENEEYISEQVLPLFEGKNEEVTDFLEEQLRQSTMRESILSGMHQALVASANPRPAIAAN